MRPVLTADQRARALAALGLVRWVQRRVQARVYVPPDLREDLRSAGVLGLLRAAQRYDPSRGSWLALAIEYIRGAMLDWLTDWNSAKHCKPDLLPISAAWHVPEPFGDIDARLTAEEILAAATPEERADMEAYMRGEAQLPRSAIAAVRARLGITADDVVDLGRTFPVRSFWSHVPHRPANGCWIWQGTLTRQGYGQFSIPVGGRGTRRWRHYLAHRAAWALEGRPLPHGARLVHTCGERRCVRPDHLRISTRRMAAIAVVLAALLLAGCELQRDEAYGVRGEWHGEECIASEADRREWYYGRTEYVLVAVCPERHPGELAGIGIILRDDGAALYGEQVAGR